MDAYIESFKALSDATRLRILNLLSHGELCVCDIISILELPQSTISRHLSTLKVSRFILAHKQGLWHYYKINKRSEVAENFLAILEKLWNHDSIFSEDIDKLNSKCVCKT